MADNLEVVMSVVWLLGLGATYWKARQAATSADLARAAAQAALAFRDELELVHSYTRLVDVLGRLRDDVRSDQWSSNLYRYDEAIELTQKIETSVPPDSQREIDALSACRVLLTTQHDRLSVTFDASKLREKDRNAMVSGLGAQVKALRELQLQQMKKAKP